MSTTTEAARYRKLCPRCWHDEKFSGLSSVEKIVFLYAITAQSNRIGLFRFSPAMAAEDLRLDAEQFRMAFDTVRDLFGWRWDETNRVLFLPKWWKYNAPEAVNNFKGSLRDLAELPRTPLFEDFLAASSHLFERFNITSPEVSRAGIPAPTPRGTPTPSEGLPTSVREGYPNSLATQEQDQDQEQEEDSSEPAKPPTSEPTAAAATKTKAKNPTNAPADSGEILLTFPTVGTGGDSWPLHASRLDEWRAAFPGIDTLAEARKALAWIHANPKKRKTAGGMPKFLVNWLGRAQNDTGRTGTANGPYRGPSTHPGYDRLPGQPERILPPSPMAFSSKPTAMASPTPAAEGGGF
jgi:hypothetical protein